MLLDPQQAANIHSEVQSVRTGEYLFRAGQNPDGFYQVIEGCIKLGFRRPTIRGRVEHDEFILQLASAGDFIGWRKLLAPLNQNEPSVQASFAQAAKDTDVRFFPRFVLENILNSTPALIQSLLYTSARDASRLENRLENFHLASVEQKIAHMLVKFSRRFGVPTEEGLRLDLSLTRNEWAQFAQTIHESFIRGLSQFQKRGWVRTEGRVIVLLDLPALQSLAYSF